MLPPKNRLLDQVRDRLQLCDFEITAGKPDLGGQALAGEKRCRLLAK